MHSHYPAAANSHHQSLLPHAILLYCAVILQAIVYLVIFSWYCSETAKNGMVAYSKENGVKIWLEPAVMRVVLLMSVHDVWGKSFSMPLLLSVWRQLPCCSWSTFSWSLRWPGLGSDPAATCNSSDELMTAQRLYYNNISRARESSDKQTAQRLYYNNISRARDSSDEQTGQRLYYNISRARDSSDEQMTAQRLNYNISRAYDSSDEQMTAQRLYYNNISRAYDSSDGHMIGQRFHHSKVSTAHDSSDEHMIGQRFHHSKVSTAHDKKGEGILGN